MAVSVDLVHLFIKNVSQKWFVVLKTKRLRNQWGHGWEVVERYISGQKGHGKTDTVHVVVIGEKENLERTKPGIYRFITNFLEGSIKIKKGKAFIVL